MKHKLVFTSLLVFSISFSQAQFTKPAKMIKNQPAETKTKESQPATSTSTNSNNSVYRLTSARVSIKTGNDNKEFPSLVYITLWIKNHQGADYQKDCLFNVSAVKNEMRINSTTELGLQQYGGSPEKFTLEALQRTGLTLNVGYLPNFFMDAWKIEGITLTLEFKDQNGNLHPGFGSKTISFNNAYGFLNGEFHSMICTTDLEFNSLLASIEK